MRLISFLGTGDYQPTRYFRPDTCQIWDGSYTASALAKLWEVSETYILATSKARDKHGMRLEEAFASANLDPPHFVELPDGKTAAELWRQFESLRELLDIADRPVILDITHGFRAQPFFAGAVVGFVRSVKQSAHEVRVLYGAFEARDEKDSTPIWDLTVFTELLEWTRALSLFLLTGRGSLLIHQVEQLARTVSSAWAKDPSGPPPKLLKLARVLKDFNEALVTVRIGKLLLGSGNRTSAAQRLLETLRAAKQDIARHIPPLTPVLDQLENMLTPLQLESTHLSGAEGRRVMTALTRLYLRLERYAEAGITLREGWVNLYATPWATTPGESFDTEARKAAEVRLRATGWTERELMGVRNDLEHGGFRKKPLPPQQIRMKLGEHLHKLEIFKDVAPSIRAEDRQRTVWFSTRHKGAVEWAERHGIRVDRLVDHIDIAEIAPGDMVIGILPVHLVAQVCAREARFFNFTLDVPPDFRGRELTLDELERFGARLEEYRVERVETNGLKQS